MLHLLDNVDGKLALLGTGGARREHSEVSQNVSGLFEAHCFVVADKGMEKGANGYLSGNPDLFAEGDDREWRAFVSLFDGGLVNVGGLFESDVTEVLLSEHDQLAVDEVLAESVDVGDKQRKQLAQSLFFVTLDLDGDDAVFADFPLTGAKSHNSVVSSSEM